MRFRLPLFFSAPVVVSLLLPVTAADVTMFGPETFESTRLVRRPSGRVTPAFTKAAKGTVQYRRYFPGEVGSGLLHLTNGMEDGSGRVPGATVLVNEVEVVTPGQLGEDTATLMAPISLLEENALETL